MQVRNRAWTGIARHGNPGGPKTTKGTRARKLTDVTGTDTADVDHCDEMRMEGGGDESDEGWV